VLHISFSKYLNDNEGRKDTSKIANMLTFRRSIRADFSANIIGQIIPLVAAVLTIPSLLNELGIDRFGILALVWSLTGYFSLFELGVGRSLTALVAPKIRIGSRIDIQAIFWAAMFTAIAIGITGAIIGVLAAPILSSAVFKQSQHLRSEVTASLRFVAMMLPLVISTTTASGILQAYRRFDLISYNRILFGTLLYSLPLLAIKISGRIDFILGSLLVLKALEFITTFASCLLINADLKAIPQLKLLHFQLLLKSGGWMTVTNVIGPLLAYSDRLLIGTILSTAAVAYYVTPLDLVVRLMIVPGALAGVLFPVFATEYEHNRNEAHNYLQICLKINYVVIFPILLATVSFSSELLTVWLGQEFAAKSASILQILAIGALANSVSYFPYAVIHAAGRPDMTARLHAAELPIYLSILWVFLKTFGLHGAALAWAIRNVCEATILFLFSSRLLIGSVGTETVRFILIGAATIGTLLITRTIQTDIITKVGIYLLSIVTFSFLSWYKVLASNEKEKLRGIWRSLVR